MKRTLVCILQNKLGAMDRILGMLTHWGFLPEQMNAHLDPLSGHLETTFVFACEQEKTFHSLIKYIRKQVYVLRVDPMRTDLEAACNNESTGKQATATFPGTPSFVPIDSKRRDPYAVSHARP